MTCISNQLYSMRLQHGAAFSSSAPNDTVGKNGRSRVGIFDVLEKVQSRNILFFLPGLER